LTVRKLEITSFAKVTLDYDTVLFRLIRSFQWILQAGTDVEATVNRARNTQPYLITLGKRGLVSSVFLVADGLIVKTPSVMAGVDSCLKLIYVANIAYEYKVERIWQFIQKIVYAIFDETTTFASVYNLQDYIKRSGKKSK